MKLLFVLCLDCKTAATRNHEETTSLQIRLWAVSWGEEARLATIIVGKELHFSSLQVLVEPARTGINKSRFLQRDSTHYTPSEVANSYDSHRSNPSSSRLRHRTLAGLMLQAAKAAGRM